MQTTVSKWGNSLALRLPRHVAEVVKLVEGSTVCVEIEDGSLGSPNSQTVQAVRAP